MPLTPAEAAPQLNTLGCPLQGQNLICVMEALIESPTYQSFEGTVRARNIPHFNWENLFVLPFRTICEHNNAARIKAENMLRDSEIVDVFATTRNIVFTTLRDWALQKVGRAD